ncbi:MAG: metallophosphoesterase [Planctomycetaceae bacterium]|nr:metallophosphoesterase [Planctomycetaceae bacterium]
MKRRTVLTLACMFALAGSLTARAATPAPIPNTWTGIERVVAIGDVHGDCKQFVVSLKAAGIINDKEDWIAGKTHLVQTGDILDRGDESRKAMDLLMKLETQAAAAGGMVHALLGNHEAMVMIGDYRFITPGEDEAFGGREQYIQAMGPEGKYGKWLRTHNTVIKINEVMFLHAGLPPSMAEMSLDQINDNVRKALNGDRPLKGLLKSGGPLWYRHWVDEDPAVVAEACDGFFTKHAVRHAVVGHTVAGVKTFGNGRVICIDSGMSAVYKGTASALVIEKGTFTAIIPDQPAVVLEVKYDPAQKLQRKAA